MVGIPQDSRGFMLAALGGLAVAAALGSPVAAQQSSAFPTFVDVHYGDHPRQVLDFWKADATNPTPVVFYIHGGGWTTADKKSPTTINVKELLAAGISVAAIN